MFAISIVKIISFEIGQKVETLIRLLLKGLHCLLSYMHLLDGWMTCDFTCFSTVFQSYQGDRRLIIKSCVQLNSVCG